MFRSAIDIAGIMLWIIPEPYMGQEQVDESRSVSIISDAKVTIGCRVTLII